MKFDFPEMIVSGRGLVKIKPLTTDQLDSIRMRADMIDDMQIRDDTFMLIAEVDLLRKEVVRILKNEIRIG